LGRIIGDRSLENMDCEYQVTRQPSPNSNSLTEGPVLKTLVIPAGRMLPCA
jgi:hypothetical protein